MYNKKQISRLAIPALLPLFLMSCGGDYTWGWYVVDPFLESGRSNIEFLLGGILNTIYISLTAITISITLGLLVSIPGISSNRYLKSFNIGFVTIIRSVPVLVMVLWVHYGLPVVLDIHLSIFATGVIALAICDSPFQAEIFRAGIQSIEKGQHEAAESMGFKYLDKMRLIILPQAIRRIIPPLGNQFVYMLKMSSLISVIGYTDLTRRATELNVTEYRPLEIYSFLILEYLVLILAVTYLFNRLENRLKAHEKLQNPHAND